jgi:hypothetical protein
LLDINLSDMKTQVKIKNETLIRLLIILSWIMFIGLLIKAGSIFLSYIISTINPEAAKSLHKGMNLSAYLDASFVNYTFIVGYKVILYVLQAYVAFLLTKLLSRLNLARPFSSPVVLTMQIMTYTILGIWVFAMLHNGHVAILEKVYGIVPNYISGEFLFLAGIVYIFAQIFKRGADLQSENELTV